MSQNSPTSSTPVSILIRCSSSFGSSMYDSLKAASCGEAS